MKKKILKTISLLTTGILLGSAMMNIYIGSQIDHLALANKTLQDRLAEAEINLQRLKEDADNKKKYSITSIEVFLIMEASTGDLTDYDQLAVEFEVNKRVKEWLKPLIGKDVSGLDSLLVPRIVDNREVEVNGNKYRLKTYLVVVNRATAVYVRAARVKSKQGE